MTVPVDPYDFANGTIADGDQVDLRFKKLYDALTPGLAGVQVFLKLLAADDIAVAFGTGVCTYTTALGGSQLITHGLGRVPKIVLCNPVAGGSLLSGQQYTGTSGQSNSQFTALFESLDRTVNLINGTVNFQWLAIG